MLRATRHQPDQPRLGGKGAGRLEHPGGMTARTTAPSTRRHGMILRFDQSSFTSSALSGKRSHPQADMRLRIQPPCEKIRWRPTGKSARKSSARRWRATVDSPPGAAKSAKEYSRCRHSSPISRKVLPSKSPKWISRRRTSAGTQWNPASRAVSWARMRSERQIPSNWMPANLGNRACAIASPAGVRGGSDQPAYRPSALKVDSP
jgi:hypothetical protein